MSGPLRIAFIGTGNMGQCAHLRNYATSERCRVVAIAEPRAELGRRVAQRWGIPAVHSDHRALIAAEEVDAFVASQPFTRHGVLLPDLLATGRPVFCEKPLARSIAVGEQLLAAERASGTFLMPGYHKRSDPAVEFAVREIARLRGTGELGALSYVRILMPAGDWIANGLFDRLQEAGRGFPDDPVPEDLDPARAQAYGAFVNYYIHQVNLMRHLLGADHQVEWADRSGKLVALRSAEGVPGLIEMSPYRTTVDWQEEALVCFERGWIRISLPAPLAINRPGRVLLFRDPGEGVAPTTVEPQLPWVHAMRRQAENFLAAVAGERQPTTTAAEALRDLQIARDWLDRVHPAAQPLVDA